MMSQLDPDFGVDATVQGFFVRNISKWVEYRDLDINNTSWSLEDEVHHNDHILVETKNDKFPSYCSVDYRS